MLLLGFYIDLIVNSPKSLLIYCHTRYYNDCYYDWVVN
jgi:hypothetical protein